MKGFLDYVREQGVVGLAVGLAIGSAAGEAVKSLVENFINPIVGFILGGTDLSKYSWTVVKIGDDRVLTIGWGAILAAEHTPWKQPRHVQNHAPSDRTSRRPCHRPSGCQRPRS